MLTEYASNFPGRVAFASLDAADFGAAQSRIRLIAGPPKLIKLLQEMPSARRVSVREAFALQGLDPRPLATAAVGAAHGSRRRAAQE